MFKRLVAATYRQRGSRAGLGAILLTALVLRLVFFVGFGLGDDAGYVAHARTILGGSYPSLDPLNQYAYRPLLLLLFVAGIGLFGYTDFGVVAPVLLAALATTAFIYVFVHRMIDRGAASWCALLYACQPFNVVNSTTMTNDVILGCLVFASVGLFLTADDGQSIRPSRRLFAASGSVMVAAFLVKITILPALCALALYSAWSLRRRTAVVLGGHLVFYLTFLAGLGCVSLVYYVKTGDPLWQFRSELIYYQTYKPEWYLSGDIDYWQLMMEYPRSLFWLSGYGSFRYFDHGLLFWLFVPFAIWLTWRGRNRVMAFLVVLTILTFSFLQFYPQYLEPRYLPLVRQTRYAEMLLPGAVIVVGVLLHQLSRTHFVLALTVMCVVLGDFVYEASRRSLLYRDSQMDVRALAAYATSTVARTGKALNVDLPAGNGLQFYLGDASVPIESMSEFPAADTYVAVGGARSFWWSRDLVFDVAPAKVPAHWVLAYEAPGRMFPWRPSHLRVYYVASAPKEAFAIFDTAAGRPPGCGEAGLRETAYSDGFDHAGEPAGVVKDIPDVDNRSRLSAPHIEWIGWFDADDDLYTFETISDDGSWIYLNETLMLDNGGTHPARTVRRTVRLERGWYALRLRYENTVADQYLRLRVYKNGPPAMVPTTLSFCAPDTVDRRSGTGP